MKVVFRKVLSLQQDGAVCSILIIDDKITILLDCGINQAFDFGTYRQIAFLLEKIQIVLITHSGREYSGAFPFLISQFGLSPKVFYTTQPIMRYAPLNLHQGILNLGLTNYDNRVFNQIYSYYENMQLLKPNQKKQIVITSVFQNTKYFAEKMPSQLKKVQISCYLSGGTICNVYWRITYGLINIVYLVQYNNYPLHHINGLNFDGLTANNTHLLITDTYTRSHSIKSDQIYNQIKQTVVKFCKQNYGNLRKMAFINPNIDKMLVFACYPNQLLIQILSILQEIVAKQFQEKENECIERIGVVHLSKGLINLIKSQSQYFKPAFREKLQKAYQFCQRSVKLENRINVCNVHTIKRILSSAQNVQIYYIGAYAHQEMFGATQLTVNNIKNMVLFKEDIQKLQQHFAKLNVAEEQFQIKEKMKQQRKPLIQSKLASKQQDYDIYLQRFKQPKVQMDNEAKLIEISQGIPRFGLGSRKKEQITQQGVRQAVIQKAKSTNRLSSNEMSIKQQESIKITNIEFQLPISKPNPNMKLQTLNLSSMSFHKTDFNSSCKIIKMTNAKDIIFINLSNNSQQLIAKYQQALDQRKSQISTTIHNSHTMPICHLDYRNDLLENEISALPGLFHNKPYQKVKVSILKLYNDIDIHLVPILDQRNEFCLLTLYAKMMQKFRCNFTNIGLIVEGISIYRTGEYSEQLFKVRKQLYAFLKLI